MGPSYAELRRHVEARLPEWVSGSRLAHILSVRDFALQIRAAQAPTLDPEAVALAAVCHDLTKHVPPAEQLALAEEAGMTLNAVERAQPWILHQRTSAYVARRDFGIQDAPILSAIARHTTGAAGMSDFDRLLYCADSVEPLRDYPGVPDLRTLVLTDLAAGFHAVLKHTLTFVLERGLPVHPDSIAAWNELCLAGVPEAATR